MTFSEGRWLPATKALTASVVRPEFSFDVPQAASATTGRPGAPTQLGSRDPDALKTGFGRIRSHEIHFTLEDEADRIYDRASGTSRCIQDRHHIPFIRRSIANGCR
jgi:hypothetical protein